MVLELKNVIEALLFSAEKALSPKEIRRILAEARDEASAVELINRVRDA